MKVEFWTCSFIWTLGYVPAIVLYACSSSFTLPFTAAFPSPSGAHEPFCTSSVTCCSMALSSSPFSGSFFSFPKSIRVISSYSRTSRSIQRTESRIHRGLGAAGFPDHDGDRWVVLLHRGVALCEEVPIHTVSSVPIVPPLPCPSLSLRIAVVLLHLGVAYLVAALCSLVWQNKNRSSFSPFPNAYFDAISRL
jgi:hypothetical protein